MKGKGKKQKEGVRMNRMEGKRKEGKKGSEKQKEGVIRERTERKTRKEKIKEW